MNIIETYKPNSLFMYNNINNSIKILAGNKYITNEWFIYNDGKQLLNCFIDTAKGIFTWAEN